MSVGYLKVNREYINPQHHTGKWDDEPENSELRFQFDPDKVKFSINTKWKEAENANDLDIPWEYDRDRQAEPTKIDLTLRFDDRVAAPPGVSPGAGGVIQRSAQRSAEILEAWATPIFQSTVQVLGHTYEESVTPAFVDHDWPGGQSINMLAMGAGVVPARRDPLIQAQKDAAYSREKMKRVRTALVSGTRMSNGTWHAPRPLLLHLFTAAPIKCVLAQLEFDIVAIDIEAGNPISIEARVTLEEWENYDLGHGLLEDIREKTVEEYKTLDAWTKAVQSGIIRQKMEPKWQYKPGAAVTTSKWG